MESPLGKLISDEQELIRQRWLDQIRRDIGDRQVEPALLQDGMPDYLRALAQILTTPGGAWHPRTREAWATVAREHGITRVQIGFDVAELVHEFAVLRRVIHELANERGLALDPAQEQLAEAVEEAVGTAVHSYVQARDFEARRKQAENIGFLTHELRNPLTAAMVATSQLKRQASEAQIPPLERLARSHARISQLIDSVLLTEKLEAGVESHPRPLKLKELMPASLEHAEAAAKKKGVAFEAHYDGDVELDVDPTLTRSAVQNLADNAAKYTDAGEVRIDIEDRPEDIVVHVRDSCIGISQEELKTLFEPFHRGSTEKAGTGLGLAIARRAVQVQGGSIGAESPGSHGCHFWIALPKHHKVVH
jgi:signal transduction histidine kinase